MTYVACVPLRWGDEDIAPGDPVPSDEAGRDYPGLLHLGQIREADDTASGGSDSELRKQLKDAKARIKELESGTDLPDGPHLIVTLSDEQQVKLSELGVEGTVSFDDLDAALTLADEDEDGASGDDAPLPEGVKETGAGWFELPDGTKVRGREAVDAALAGGASE